MGESKPDYAVVIDQEPEGNQSQQNTVVAPSGFKLSPGMRAVLPIASYCFASILMTVTNKYVLSGYDFNMNFLLLTIQVSKGISLSSVQCALHFMIRTWSLFCYCNHSSSSTSSSSVILIKMRLASGCPLLLRSSLWFIQAQKHSSFFVFPSIQSSRTWPSFLSPMVRCFGLAAVLLIWCWFRLVWW